MVSELSIHFKTEELSRTERLNGFEFKAVTSVESGPFRWWIPQTKTWREWQVGEFASPVILIKKKGVWSKEMPEGRNADDLTATTTCSGIPAMEDQKR